MKSISIINPVVGNKIHIENNIEVCVDDYIVYDEGGFEFIAKVANVNINFSEHSDRIDKNKSVVRIASSGDFEVNLRFTNIDVRAIFDKAKHNVNLDIEFVGYEYSLNKRKLKVYFYKNGTVDFREFIQKFLKLHGPGIKFELVQISGREYSANAEGVGVCGLELCCHNINYSTSRSPRKKYDYRGYKLNLRQSAVGYCGHYKCCISFEVDDYVNALKKVPKYKSKLTINDKIYICSDVDVLRESLTLVSGDETINLKFSEIGEYYEG